MSSSNLKVEMRDYIAARLASCNITVSDSLTIDDKKLQIDFSHLDDWRQTSVELRARLDEYCKAILKLIDSGCRHIKSSYDFRSHRAYLVVKYDNASVRSHGRWFVDGTSSINIFSKTPYGGYEYTNTRYTIDEAIFLAKKIPPVQRMTSDNLPPPYEWATSHSLNINYVINNDVIYSCHVEGIKTINNKLRVIDDAGSPNSKVWFLVRGRTLINSGFIVLTDGTGYYIVEDTACGLAIRQKNQFKLTTNDHIMVQEAIALFMKGNDNGATHNI